MLLVVLILRTSVLKFHAKTQVHVIISVSSITGTEGGGEAGKIKQK